MHALEGKWCRLHELLTARVTRQGSRAVTVHAYNDTFQVCGDAGAQRKQPPYYDLMMVSSVNSYCSFSCIKAFAFIVGLHNN